MDDRRRDDQPDRGPSDGPEGRCGPGGGPGSDTQFLQLEMSRVLYAEAQGVTKQAVRELLLEAAKAHLRERFGETITRLGQLATDELLTDIEASLEIEERIQRRRESSGGTEDRVREALARSRPSRSQPSGERQEGRARARKRRR
jgi:hypothetical protein